MIDRLHSFTFADVTREHRRNHPRRTATVDGDVRLTWPELDDRTNRLANALLAAGVGPGDVVLWLGQNSSRIMECLAAAAKIGAVCCVANWRQSADELLFVLDDARPAVVVWQEAEIGSVARDAMGRASDTGIRWVRHDADADDPDGYEAFLRSAQPTDPDLEVDPAAPVLMLYTAAFAGTPNGALFPHQALLAQALMVAGVARIDARYTYLNCGPLFHVATLMTTLATWLMAGVNVFTPRVDAAELCRLVQEERCTGAFITGPTIDQMVELNAPDAEGRRPYDLSSLRAFRGRRRWNEMITLDDAPWATRPAGFGQTEVMGMLTYNSMGADCLGSAGRPSPLAAVRIVDPDGNEVPVGDTGEIVVRGPQVTTGYHDRPGEDERRRRGGWYHTTDLGRREADGSISFVAPMGRIIKSAAENIYPGEVENALASNDAVRECAVIGVPDPQWGQSVTAIVVLHDGASATEQELIDHVRSRIASYKKPKAVIFRDAPLPRLGWPLDYDALDAAYGGGGYPGSG